VLTELLTVVIRWARVVVEKKKARGCLGILSILATAVLWISNDDPALSLISDPDLDLDWFKHK
jgi:hypothetical protein